MPEAVSYPFFPFFFGFLLGLVASPFLRKLIEKVKDRLDDM